MDILYSEIVVHDFFFFFFETLETSHETHTTRV